MPLETARYLIDTNVLSELARPRPDGNVKRFLSAQERLKISSLTWFEIAYGIASQADPVRKEQLTLWLAAAKAVFADATIGIDTEIAEIAGRLRVHADQNKRRNLIVDSLIGACAVRHELVVLTRNTMDFEAMNVPCYDPWRTP